MSIWRNTCTNGIVNIVQTTAWGMRSAVRRKVNVFDEVFEKFGWSVTNG